MIPNLPTQIVFNIVDKMNYLDFKSYCYSALLDLTVPGLFLNGENIQIHSVLPRWQLKCNIFKVYQSKRCCEADVSTFCVLGIPFNSSVGTAIGFGLGSLWSGLIRSRNP